MFFGFCNNISHARNLAVTRADEGESTPMPPADLRLVGVLPDSHIYSVQHDNTLVNGENCFEVLRDSKTYPCGERNCNCCDVISPANVVRSTISDCCFLPKKCDNSRLTYKTSGVIYYILYNM